MVVSFDVARPGSMMSLRSREERCRSTMTTGLAFVLRELVARGGLAEPT
jgi:hypothetical protein